MSIELIRLKIRIINDLVCYIPTRQLANILFKGYLMVIVRPKCEV